MTSEGIRKRKASASQPKDDANGLKKDKMKKTKKPVIEKRKAPDAASPVPAKKQKSAKPLTTTVNNQEAVGVKKELTKTRDSAKKGGKACKKDRSAQDTAPGSHGADEPPVDAENDEKEAEEDENTKALVSALDSEEEDLGGEDNQDTFKKGEDVGKVPKTIRKLPHADQGRVGQETGVVYLGRIPHGFAEQEMRSYFSQFGDVTRMRLSRNKKTGKSKHYGFIEFADKEVAEIVAQTMDSYLLYGHILRAKVVPKSQIHPELWKGANRKFRTMPRNKMVGRHLAKPAGETTWTTRIRKEQKRRLARSEKLRETMGYEFEEPALKIAHVQATTPISLGKGDDGNTHAIEEAPRTTAEKEPELSATDQAHDEPADTEGTLTQPRKAKGDKGSKRGKKAKKTNKA